MKIARSQLSRQKPVNIERAQHIGHYGVIFTVTRFTVVPDNRHALANLSLFEIKTAARQVRDQMRRLYEKMLARDLPWEMAVAISHPLRRNQADRLNDQNVLIKQIISGAVKAPGIAISTVTAGFAGDPISGKLRRYHAGDIIIGLDASVRGGIGPQRSTRSMHVYSDES
ncbi:hypothetical protein [Pseudomonas fluorescens]|uniref:hypothetical protein n=1 Tax=Pseudomonas fluorescens TaxID=294 RepID=UPI001D0C2A67|nr:hypothetical protein [Pseudomonas fluorescens]